MLVLLFISSRFLWGEENEWLNGRSTTIFGVKRNKRSVQSINQTIILQEME